MAYKIFISYFTGEQELANKVKAILSAAFKTKVHFFLASEKLLPGENWKIVLQKALEDYDAILTIVTPKYLTRPWIFIEWAAFWLKNKTTYLVMTDDVPIGHLVDPMRDSQYVKLFKEDDIEKLFEKISKDINQDNIPYDFALKLTNESRIIYDKLKEQDASKAYRIYKEDINLLPNDSAEKKKIFWYFYSIADFETAKAIFGRITVNTTLCNILIDIVDKGNLQYILDLLHVDNQ